MLACNRATGMRHTVLLKGELLQQAELEPSEARDLLGRASQA